ncbi:ATP-binding cassette transporter abc4 [Paramyrothecium foliicola]|nr:ATP-binding cassette transporter abc4 [Paramyrothecium foliicola]
MAEAIWVPSDPVILRFGRHEFSPLAGSDGTRYAPAYSQSLQHVAALPTELQWVSDVSEFAQSGTLQFIILASSAASLTIWWLRRKHEPQAPKRKPSPVPWPYELLSQVARFASLAFAVAASIQGRAHLLNVVVLAYASILGLFRLSNDLAWRKVALVHVNFVMTGLLFVFLVAQFLPCVQVGVECVRDFTTTGAVASLAMALVVAITTPTEWVPPSVSFEIPGRSWEDEKPAPEETCSWLDYYCTYNWLNPVIWKGTRGKLDISGIPRLAWYDEPLYLLRRIQKARSMAGNTLWTTIRFQERELSKMAFVISIAYSAENIAPYGMFKLLDYIADPTNATYQPWVWLSLMFLGPLIRTVFFQQYSWTSTRLIVRIKSAMTQELYHRALGSMELEDDPFEPNESQKSQNGKHKTQTSTSAGRLANLMASDVDAIFRARDIIMGIAGVPAGTLVSLIGLYRMLGWASLVGILVLILAAPVSVWFGKLMLTAQRRARLAQDTRISLVTEYLASIRAIKYFAWEDAVTEKIVSARAAEQKQLWRVSVTQALINQVTQIFPYVSLLVMFGLHVGLENKRLDASTAFTTVFLVSRIRRNIMQISSMGRTFASAMVSFSRLDKYFESTVPLTKYPTGPLCIRNASFRRNRKAIFRLEHISIDFVEGGLNVVSGQSGSGKSTLLLSILGETYLEGGSLTVPDDVAFASQSPWLQNDTIKENILFGSQMERVRYDRVLQACRLLEDLRDLGERDMTVVGENGTSLSGGQKARVALARALYSKAPLLLLDDVFSALDAKTAAGVWKYCFCTDLLKGRTVVLVTQVPWIAAQADLAIALEKGQVQEVEPHIGVVREPINIAEVLGGNADEPVASAAQSETENEIQANGDAANDQSKIAEDKSSHHMVSQEAIMSGRVGRLTFLQYMGYFGNPIFAISCILGIFLSNIAYTGSGFWLSKWVGAYKTKAHVDIAYYMGIYSLFTLGEVAMYAVVIVGFEWGAWRAARKLHNDFIRAIMGVSLSWFKAIPVGRITNRFSGDMASIDGSLGSVLRTTVDAFQTLFFRIAAVGTIMPIFILPALFTCFMGVIIGEMYTRTAVVIKRLTSSAQSPVFSQFADTLAGLPVIRARAGMSQAFGEELAAKLRVWSASAEANYNCNRWVAVRVDFVTALVSLCAGIIAVTRTGTLAAGLVGFSLTNANALSQTILWLVRAMNDLEVEMQSFHRVKEYVKLEPEEKDDDPYPEEGKYADDEGLVIPKDWPRSGDIEFRNVTIRYDPDGPNILNNVNLRFRAGERVAVVGRTGSGKSTLVLSLLRFTHIVSGQILYDGMDITKIPRHRLREGLTIIPQEAVLFNGTVESNLDPTGSVPTETLDKALENCKGIASFSDDDDSTVAKVALGEPTDTNSQGISLSSPVDAKGENFSHGQRQVLSLCRALIRQSKLMLLDEATASMDYETDRGIQQVLRDELETAGGGRTLVTIAHRLRTIIDYDTVVVMSAGRVLECGSPGDLYNARGQFYDMVYHSGEMEELRSMLER